MRVLLLRTWLRNIGNGFIDMGARSIIEKAAPEAEVVEVSGYPNWVASQRELGQLAGITGAFGPAQGLAEQIQKHRNSVTNRFINIGELVDADLAILPGCVLYQFALEIYRPLLEDLNDRDIPIVIMGAGGGDYAQSTQQYVRDFLSEIEPIGLMTRDEIAYQVYSDTVEHTYNGIDCAFFIDDWYTPPQANTTFDAAAFDKQDEPADISNGQRIIRTDHVPFGEPHKGFTQKVQTARDQHGFFESNNILVSDNIRDYLFIYKNAIVTHSDRIHACVPTLAYGNQARFWFSTPRAALFERVLNEDISGEAVSIDQHRLSRQKSEQVSALAQIISDISVGRAIA